MMKNSLAKWASNFNNKSGEKESPPGPSSSWIHPPESLQKNHVAYLIKFLGYLPVSEPKGLDVVKSAMEKLQSKNESGKIQKVELTISIDGVNIQDPKTKVSMHQYPLYRISYCADDKLQKKFISFIVREQDSEQHTCFIFLSDKLSEDIALTIGQAFELAYKRFQEMEVQRRLTALNRKVKTLENENSVLKQRLSDIIFGHEDVSTYMKKNNIADMLVVNEEAEKKNENRPTTSEFDVTSNGSFNLLNFNSSSSSNQSLSNGTTSSAWTTKNNDTMPTVGTRLEGLVAGGWDDDFDPRAFEQTKPCTTSVTPPLLAPPPKIGKDNARKGTPSARAGVEEVFGSILATPRPKPTQNPFGNFSGASTSNNGSPSDYQSAIGLLDRRINEMKDGFSRGLSTGTTDEYTSNFALFTPPK